jgi:hypothetical protein
MGGESLILRFYRIYPTLHVHPRYVFSTGHADGIFGSGVLKGRDFSPAKE